MANMSVSLSMCEYDRTRALIDGRVKPQGVDLNLLVNTIEDSVIRMLRHEEFDAAEMSLSAALIAVDSGQPNFILLPIFPSRYFRHSAIFVTSSSSLESPGDLRGKRVAAPTYARLTAGVWIRGILEDDYGLDPADLDWTVAEPLPIGSMDRIPVTLPDALHVRSVAVDTDLERLLLEGDVDALITARLPRGLSSSPPGIRRLLRDVRAVEAEYFERTSIFPPMHVIVIRRDLYERHPWLGPSLFAAFATAKNLLLRDLRDIDVSRTSFAWAALYAESELNVLGHDAWPYGLAPNRHVLETFARYCFTQGLTARLIDVEEIFPANVRELSG